MRLDLIQSHAWQVSLGRFVLLLVTALAVGFALGEPLHALLVALFGYSLWSLVGLYRIQAWLRSRRRAAPPEDRGVWSDVSEMVFRKLRAERSRKRRLIALLRAFREAAAALPDGVVVLTRGRALLWCNEAATRLLGVDARRDRGKLLDNFIAHPRYFDWLARGPESEQLLDVPSPRDPDVRLSLKLISYARDQQLLVARDVTKLLQLEQVRRDFVANVSHELRTPLTVLHGYLDIFEPEDAPQWAPMVADMRAQSARMQQIVEDLLVLSRLESEHESAIERIPMRATIKTLEREAQALSQGQHQIRAEIRSSRDVHGSPKELHSAFSNLVSNAVRYTPAGGAITLVWEDVGDGARFTVRDTGYGIPPEHLPRLTERFYRVSTSRSREKGGTGLGLAIVKHVLNRHGARLEIESVVGKGSAFSCLFDAAHVIEADDEPLATTHAAQ